MKKNQHNTNNQCHYINRMPIIWRGQEIGAPSIGQCQETCLPGMVVCVEHATKDALAFWIETLAQRVVDLGGKIQ